MASCTRIDGMIQAYVDGELSPSDRVILEQHVGTCPQCGERVRGHRRLSAELFESFSDYRLCRDLQAPVLENLPEMELPSDDLATVNRRAKQPPRGWRLTARYLPVAAIAIVAGLGLMINQYWPQARVASDALGIVLQSKGRVQHVPAEGTAWSGTFSQHAVRPGELFTTGSESTLMLGLKGQTVLKLNQKSRVKIDTARRVSLEEGEVWLDVGRDGQLFRVVTRDGTITVFGTAFSVRVANSGTTVAVERGEVVMGNRSQFTNLRQGEKASLSTARGLTKTERIDPAGVALWAKLVVPDGSAEALFQEFVLSNSVQTELAAQAVFFVDPSSGGKKWAIRSINVYWEADSFSDGHCSYDVYVCDDQMRPLFMDRIPGAVFDKGAARAMELTVPGGPIQGVRWVFVRLVPDVSTGARQAKGLAVRAAASQL